MKYIFNLLFSFIFINITPAQLLPIDTDRPDLTESAFLVPKKWLQFEAGFSYQVNNNTEKEYFTPSLLSKYGLTDRIELRLITSILTQSRSALAQDINNETGLEAVEIGAKIGLTEEKDIFPKTSFIFHVAIPGLSSTAFKPGKVAPDFRFTMQHTLSPKTSAGYNLGCEWDGFSNDPAYIYTLTLGYVPANKWYSYIEGFGSFKKQEIPQHSLDGGLAYLVTINFKIDLSSGFGLTETAPQWYIAFGISARINTNK
ncbi:MAG TPA: transporter [Ferruginibacter sp.]|nr:transporter [Ferruginibacter sp.]